MQALGEVVIISPSYIMFIGFQKCKKMYSGAPFGLDILKFLPSDHAWRIKRTFTTTYRKKIYRHIISKSVVYVNIFFKKYNFYFTEEVNTNDKNV